MRTHIIEKIQGIANFLDSDRMPAKVLAIYGYGDFLTNEFSARADLIIRYLSEDKPNELFVDCAKSLVDFKNKNPNESKNPPAISIKNNFLNKLLKKEDAEKILLWFKEFSWEDLSPMRLDHKIRFGHNDMIFRKILSSSPYLLAGLPIVSIQEWINEKSQIHNSCKLLWSVANKDILKNINSPSNAIEISSIREMQELFCLSQRNDWILSCISALRLSRNSPSSRIEELVNGFIYTMPSVGDTLSELPEQVIKTMSMFGTREIEALKIIVKEARIRLEMHPYFLKAMCELYTNKASSINNAIVNILEKHAKNNYPRSGLYLAVKPLVNYMESGNEDYVNKIKITDFTISLKG